jgi:fatty acid amide hydrolase 2
LTSCRIWKIFQPFGRSIFGSVLKHLLTASATHIAKLIRTGEVTSRAAVEIHLAEIQRVNPSLNAVVAHRADEARAEADRADATLREVGADSVPAFHGVPCTVKENFAFRGMPNTAGLVARKGYRPERDAVTVTRLRDAGAIPMGVTNCSELCMWLESNNQVYGRTTNSYAPGRIAGGSSGGEGSIVGSGASPFGLGADFAGSIRFPAFFNGVFGHKPTGGLVPATGQWPVAENEAQRYLTTGPICRRAEDLMPLLRILAGPDGEDDGCRELALGDPAAVDLSSLRVVDIRGNGMSKVSPAIASALERASDHLASLGADITRPRIPHLKRSFEVWSAVVSEAQPSDSFRSDMRRTSARELLGQLGLWAVGRSDHTFPALGLALVENIGASLPALAQRSVERFAEIREALVDALGDHGVMIYPTFPRVAPRHRWPAVRIVAYSLASAYASLINVLEFPSTQVPMGLDEAGLPTGFQVVSTPGNDHLTIAVALELERAFGGWTPPRRFAHRETT